MTAILCLLIGIVIIIRIFYILDSMWTYDFIIGITPIMTLCLTPIWLIFIWWLKRSGRFPRKRLNVSNGWAIASWVIIYFIPTLVWSFLKGDNLVLVVIGVIINIWIFILWRPMRAAMFVTLNILLLGLVVYKLDAGVNGIDDISNNLESTPDVTLADSGMFSTDNAQDLQLANGITVNIDSNMPLDTLQQNFTADCFFPINNTFTIDPSHFIGNIVSPTDTIVLSDASGMPSMTLRDGVIFDGGSSQIGSYEYNQGMDRTVFFDSSHNPVYSVNSNGVYFDASGQQIGCARNVGSVTTVFDGNEQPIYQIDNATKSIFDKYGRPMGTIRQG